MAAYDPADLFEAMAERIRRNPPEEFAGCVLIVPPPSAEGNSGEPIELLLIDPAPDLVDFWTTAKAKASIAADEFIAQQQVPQMGGYR